MKAVIYAFFVLILAANIYADVNPSAPSSTVRVTFIHHSTGEDWLSIGGLRQALNGSNYYVTDTNYGWDPDGIGDLTDIGHWHNWFLGGNRDTYMAALYANDHITGSIGPNSISDPGGGNDVIMFKSCFPNSNVVGGNTNDPPLAEGTVNPIWGEAIGGTYTVENIKGLYRDLLEYFATRQDKLFILITSPPLIQGSTDSQAAARHRAICDWLVDGWLDSYPHNNVFAFDYYNVLTSNAGNPNANDLGADTGNHHRYKDGAIEHVTGLDNNYSAYGEFGDSHPTAAGHQKATGEYIPLLNIAYNAWQTDKTYYVATDGDDNNPGTYDDPWATPGYGSKQLQAGDTMVIMGGTYILSQFYDDMITPLNSGTADAWITIKGEDGNTPTLAGRDNLFSAINLEGISYIKIENLEITNDSGAWFRDGINGDELANIELKELSIHHIDEFGINFTDVNGLLIDDCDITYCGFGSIGGPDGDSGGWQNITIQECNLSYNGHYYQGGDGAGNPYDRPDGFGIEESNGPIEIVDCIAEHNKGDGLDSKSGNTYIYNCVVANNSCDGIKLWGDNSKVHNSLVYGTGDGVGGATPWAAVVIGTDAENSDFELINVTIHDTTETENYPMYVQYDSSATISLVMKNCIVAGGYGAVFIGDSVAFTAEHNIFYRPGNDPQVYANERDYTAQQIEAGQLGLGNISRDPLFVDPAWGTYGDYHLQNGSPAVDTGTSGIGIPNNDIEYNSRPQGNEYDMGAYECDVSAQQSGEAPSVIVDLYAESSAAASSVDLEWTAPGDDGNTGTASSYIIRYNTESITESNWDESVDVAGEPAPEVAGTVQNMTANVPYANVTYYFAIKTQDDEANISEISNSPYALSTAIMLYEGWNLIAPALTAAISLPDAIASIQEYFISIWIYDASIGEWLRYIASGPEFLNNLEELCPGFGCWVQVSANCAWDLGSGAIASPANSLVQRPPFIIYGEATNGREVSIRSKDIEVDKYIMGSIPLYGQHYVLEIPYKTNAELNLYIDGMQVQGSPIEHPGMGIIKRYDAKIFLPKATRLLQNYPNPFNPETWIPYQLSEDLEVTIRIYSATGQLIRTMSLGHKKAGIYTAKCSAAYWDGLTSSGERAASGIYHYVLQADNLIAIQKMVVIR